MVLQWLHMQKTDKREQASPLLSLASPPTACGNGVTWVVAIKHEAFLSFQYPAHAHLHDALFHRLIPAFASGG
eukprot:711885-Amphidinium_carterae.1